MYEGADHPDIAECLFISDGPSVGHQPVKTTRTREVKANSQRLSANNDQLELRRFQLF
jgi:hypothetical protein